MPQIVVVLLSVAAFVGKTVLLCWLQLMIRWTVPRFRYDQLMKLGWQILLPISIGNVFLTGVAVRLVQVAHLGSSHVFQLAGNLTQVLVAGAALWTLVALGVELLKPAHHRRFTLTSIANYVEQMGGLRSRRMGA
jgi:hypothetical protein